jgi:HSP20 family protein
MAIVRLNPARDLGHMERELRRMLRSFESSSEEPASMALWAPPVDIFETDNEVVVRAELPGMDQKDIDIRIDNNVLTIKGERKMDQRVKEENYHRIESMYGTFVRSFTLPTNVDPDNVKAEYRIGILTITLPKKEQSKPRQIKLSA